MLFSVVTADLVRSRDGKRSQQETVEILQQIFAELCELPGTDTFQQPFTVFRGDAFQGVLKGSANTLLVSVFLRASIQHRLLLDVRQAIGIGAVSEFVQGSPLLSSGEAFVRSGHLLDEISIQKSVQRRISVSSGNPEFDDEFNTCFALLEVTARRWTEKEAEAIVLRLKGNTQDDIAKQLKINQSAVHKRLQSAGWYAIDSLLKHWDQRTRLPNGHHDD